MNDTHIRATDIANDALTVTWGDGQQSRFHSLWLRDNCACEACGPHESGSRLQRLLDIPDDVTPAKVQTDGATLRVIWAGDEHSSRYDADWLLRNAYTPAPLRARRKPHRTLWDAGLPEWPAVEWDRVLVDDAERYRLHASVSELGFVLVRGLGTGHGAIETLANEVGYIRETHYGRIFDLITRAKPMILADLAGPLLPHTDEAYRRVPTGINIFHCIQPSADGGGVSQLVDAFRVAAILREKHPEAFELLTKVPVRHERRIEDQVITSDLPAIVLDHDGDVIEVRLNERTMTAICVDDHLMASTYAALRTAFRTAYDPAQLVSYLLRPGEALLFDNLRVLHARTGYSGDRFVRQTQVMRDEFFGKGAALAEKVDLPHSVLRTS
ncbi:gamma-butyrobetaine dioxygenase [Yinghuangia aomiensis]|uniref:Gamma-butyrobetaine dioxygenase n=1 Tax=Yinghuangia aomiensis TaxID=676205 RepID=A0ABP9I9X3_9ACTN